MAHLHIRVLKFLARGSVAAAVVCGLTVYFQDYLVVPLAFSASDTLVERRPGSISRGMTSEFISTRDGVKVEVWSSPERPGQKGTALFFAGNGEPIERVSRLSPWFESIGYRSFFLSYRGTGRSAGSVSEEGFYADADALWQYAVTRRMVPAEKVVVFSHSLGSGPAAYIAQTRSPAAAVLLSPFSSLREVVAEMPLYNLLIPFLHWNFPVAERLAELPDTCVILAHGTEDNVIGISHPRRIEAGYKGKRALTFIEVPGASHNDILNPETVTKVTSALESCVSS